ncbi:MAG: hypothetical protein IPN69_15170 [Acidobacteria bacterium]|nr:hypothetical protein [Acidobacteriota bacterium]MBK8147768.1 hypothetical protein [Acidobacteriota bacterium]MBK8812052.1 hypothetical protein [Acidobacteriota bacterium]
MKIAVLYFLCLIAIQAFANPGWSQTPCPMSAAENVRIRTELLDRMSIETGDDEVSTIDLKLKLTFSNVGKSPVRIYKGWVSASHFWISKSDAEANKKEFELSSSVSVLTDDTRTEPAFSIDEFATISGEQTYSTELLVRIPFLKSRLSPGIHVLKLQIETWRWFGKEREKETRVLAAVGRVLTDPVVTEPVIFRID